MKDAEATKVTNLTLLLKAISYAARRHEGQRRKDGATPYVAHPMRVSTILAQEFKVSDPDVLCAALLHDTIEDTTADWDDIAKEFGRKIASWVAALSKDKRLEEAERERVYYEGLVRSGVEVKLCKLGDALDNLIDSRSLAREGKEKALRKARHLLELFSPGFPEAWLHVLDRVKREVFEVERELSDR